MPFRCYFCSQLFDWEKMTEFNEMICCQTCRSEMFDRLKRLKERRRVTEDDKHKVDEAFKPKTVKPIKNGKKVKQL